MLTATQRIRVEWAHCDQAGIIFNPHYYIWMDSGTHALLQAAGFDLVGQVRSIGCTVRTCGLPFVFPGTDPDLSLTDRIKSATDALEARILGETLETTGGNKAAAARALQIDYTTMHRKLKRHGLL